MIKTARFKIYNPSQHKRAMLDYAFKHHHLTLKRMLEQVAADPDFEAITHEPDKKGRPRPNKFKIEKYLRQIPPKGWVLAPLRDYVIRDVSAMLMSHLNKAYKGKNKSNPPTMPKLEALTQQEYDDAYTEFATSHTFPLKPKHIEKIQKAQDTGQNQVARRLTKVYSSYAATTAAGLILRKLEGAVPRPIQFEHCEFKRGILLAHKGNRLYLFARLFGEDSKYNKITVLEEGFSNYTTHESLAGKKYPGLIFPLEFGRDFHQNEYLTHGNPRTAKLVPKRNQEGEYEYYFHIAFEFNAEPVIPETVLGIDRGAAKLGAGTLLTLDGTLIQSGINLDGAAFSEEMKHYRQKIADQQRRGKRQSRFFKLRKRRSDAVLGEYANKIIQIALVHKSQIILEAINQRFMAGVLTQSQFGKLKLMLEYKAERVGLHKPVEVPAAYTSQTCAACGAKDKANRPKKDASGKNIQDVFCCTSCGYRANADDNASEIIALRGIHQMDNGGRKFRKFDDFQLWLKELTGRDESRPARVRIQ